jgi:hypothetical protein
MNWVTTEAGKRKRLILEYIVLHAGRLWKWEVETWGDRSCITIQYGSQLTSNTKMWLVYNRPKQSGDDCIMWVPVGHLNDILVFKVLRIELLRHFSFPHKQMNITFWCLSWASALRPQIVYKDHFPWFSFRVNGVKHRLCRGIQMTPKIWPPMSLIQTSQGDKVEEISGGGFVRCKNFLKNNLS